MSGDTYLERVNLGNCFVDLPQEICEQKSLFEEILSEDTWNSVLSNEQRTHLSKFLPSFPEDDAVNKQQTIQQLLSGQNFRFGNPVDEFHRKLKGGHFLPEVSRMNAVLNKVKQREYAYQQQRYFYKQLQEILISRRKLLDVASQLPPEQPLKMERIQSKPTPNSIEKRTKRRYLRELQDIRQEVGELDTSSEDENYPDFVAPKMTKRQKRHLAQLEASLSTEAGSVASTWASKSTPIGNGSSETRSVRSISPFEVFEDDYREMLMNHKRRRIGYEIHPELDVDGITLQEVELRTNIPKRSSSSKPAIQLETKSKGNKDKERRKVPATTAQSSLIPLSSIKTEPGVTEPVVPTEIPLLIPKVELFANYPPSPVPETNVLPPSIEPSSFPDDSLLDAEIHNVEPDFGFTLPRSSTPVLGHANYASFFSMLRDFMCESYDCKILPSKLEEKVVAWQESPFSALNDWYPLHGNWADLVVPALKFLSGQVTGPVPEKFVPLVDYKEKLQYYRWSGEGSDSDENLTFLSTFWLETRAEEGPVPIPDVIDSTPESPPPPGSPPPPRVLTDWTVQQTTDDEKHFYREQERLRYENPHRAFTFFLHGYEAVVGPVKGVYAKDGSVAKAREHSLLVPDRPPFVTILSLVRDSAARLPNGEGTRADICELLKDSQFLAPATDVQIHTVVSGALDRLHYEKDPCVKYDVNRKMWIYLHRCRTEEEFERIHQAQATTVKTKKVGSKPKTKQTKSKTSSRPASAMSTASSDSLLSLEATSSTSSVVISASSSPVSARATNANTRTSTVVVSSSPSPVTLPVLTSSTVTKVALSSTAKSTIPTTAFFQPLSTTASQSSVVNVSQVTTVPTVVRSAPIAKTLKVEHHETVSQSQSDIGVPSPSFIVPQTSSRPSSTGSAHSLPSPKSVIANVNAAQLVNIAQVQLIGTTSSTSVMPITVSTTSPKLSTNVVAQLTAIQQQQHQQHHHHHHLPKTVSAIMAQQAAANAAAAKAITVTTQSLGAVRLVPSGTNISHTNAMLTAKTISSPIAGHTVTSHGTHQGVPTIVIKQDTGLGLVSSTQQARGSIQGSKPVVARIISAPQVVSVGNLIASTLAATQKQGNPNQAGTTTIKIQGSNLLHPMATKGGHLNVLKTSNTTCPTITGMHSTGMPRLTLVSQGNTANLIPVSGTTVTVQPKLVATAPGQIGIMASQLTSQQSQLSSNAKPTILTTQGGIKIMSAGANPSMTLAQLGGKATQTVVMTSKAQPPTVTVSMGTTAGTTQNLILTGSMQSATMPAVVIASQRALKPAQTVMMGQSGTAPTMVMATQPTLRPITATTMTSGVKVIPVTQATAIVRGKTQPVFTRIITPPAGLTLRPASSLTASSGTQGVGVIHAMAAHVPTASLMAATNAGTNATFRNTAATATKQQATIIRVQTPNIHSEVPKGQQ